MAKAKKTETPDAAVPTTAPITAPATAPKKKAVKAKAAAKPQPAAAAPMVDTTLAAAAAAKGLVAGLGSGSAVTAGKSSASFAKMKESLGKPAGGLGSVLDQTTPSALKKANQPFGGSKTFNGTNGRNQTFGADVSRASVPRRTGGG